MEFIRENWTEADGIELIDYLKSIAKEDRIEWTKRVFNTKSEVLAIPSPDLKNIAKEIAKGDFLSFLNLKLYDYKELFIINAYLIVRVIDLDLRKELLLDYLSRSDSWADTDTIKPIDLKKNGNWWWDLGFQLRNSEDIFTRRFGVVLLLLFASDLSRGDCIIDILSSFQKEGEYYVNMALAWVTCEMMIKQRDRALKLFERDVLSSFVTNKSISKCRDSFRITAEDKQLLLQFRK